MQKRAGTENVPGIVGTAVALALASEGVSIHAPRVRSLRERLRTGIVASVPDAVTNGCQENCLPNNLNVSFEGLENDDLVARLDSRGIATSTGSACANAMWEPSHVLLAMGVPIRRAAGNVRFSLGEGTTEGDIQAVLRVLPDEVKQARLSSLATR